MKLIKFILKLIKFILNKFVRRTFMPMEEYKGYIRGMSKSKLIDEIVYQAGVINKNKGQFKSEDRKHLRKHSNKHLERTLIMLKMYEDKKIRKMLEEETKNVYKTITKVPASC